MPITLKPFKVGVPQTLFTMPNLFAFDAQNRANVEFVLVSGWVEELRAKVRPSR